MISNQIKATQTDRTEFAYSGRFLKVPGVRPSAGSWVAFFDWFEGEENGSDKNLAGS